MLLTYIPNPGVLPMASNMRKFISSRSPSYKYLRPLITHYRCLYNFCHLQSMEQEAIIIPINEGIIADPPLSPICFMSPSGKIRKEETMQNSQYVANKMYVDKKSASIKAHPFHSPLPFDFQYSYSETNSSIKPISFREPRFSPFGPGKLDRKWTGWSAPALAKPMGASSLETFNFEEWKRSMLGEPLSESEVEELVSKYGHSDCVRQINLGILHKSRLQHVSPHPFGFLIHLFKHIHTKNKYTHLFLFCFFRYFLEKKGRGGVTHNMLDDIHNHWKRAEAVRIKCLGVPTLDMDNVCFHLEDKTGGKVISRRTNILLLYRGRNYDPKERPVIPLMLWKPHAPIYPKLVKYVPSGLTWKQTKEMRSKGLNSTALTKLTQNGVYVNVVEKVRQAFKMEEVVRLDCTYVEKNDCKKIGVKLRDLVPCVPLLFKNGQIIIWRGERGQTSVGQQIHNTISTPSTVNNLCSSLDANEA